MSTTIGFGKNIASLLAQGRLGSTTAAMASSLERLSSGLRINRASDDAAGLAIATTLGADTRVYSQGIRNINDGISALNIADGALNQFSSILMRLRELATQAANGSFSLTQRRSLDSEAFQLTNEFNRLTQSTRFNGLNLLDGGLSSMRIQLGYGASGSIAFGMGQSLGQSVGTGGFSSPMTTFTAQTVKIATGDMNGDGKPDIVSADIIGSGVFITYGNGNGTFAAPVCISDAPAFQLQVGDVNGDGKLDIVGTDAIEMYLLLGNGNGTFQATKTINFQPATDIFTLKDMNNDGRLDIITADTASNYAVFLANSNGTFQAAKTSANALGANFYSVSIGDLNGDGYQDVLGMDVSGGKISVALGNGDGTLRAARTYATGAWAGSVTVGDINHDGILDIVTGTGLGGTGAINTLLGNGDGSFRARTSINISGASGTVRLGDLNGDGYLDIVSHNWSTDTFDILIGNGNGTFRAAVSFTGGGSLYLSSDNSMSLTDMNGDGVLDIVAAGPDANFVAFGSTNFSTNIARLNLTTREEALNSITAIDAALARVNSERGALGAAQSRLVSGVQTLQASVENYTAAKSRISDVDVAHESSQLLRLQISQQAATAVLAQANQIPALALLLLKGS